MWQGLSCLAMMLSTGCGSMVSATMSPAPPAAAVAQALEPEFSDDLADANILANATSPPLAGNWRMIFEDNFSGSQLNPRNWSPCYWWDWQGIGCTNAANKEVQWYLPGNLDVRGGELSLTARAQSLTAGDGKPYTHTSGMISSHDKFTFRYGYAEIRARVPAGRGLWPAFWLLANSRQWPPEIDVMEIQGHEPTKNYMTTIYGQSEDAKLNQCSWSGPNFSQGFHTFGVLWQEDVVIWYIDGVERCRVTQSHAIPKEPMYLVANLAVGGWAGSPAGTQFPAALSIDYIRVWQK